MSNLLVLNVLTWKIFRPHNSLGTATWLWRDHKLQAGEDVSCPFGASSLSSMSTLTAAASLSLVQSFPVQLCASTSVQPNVQKENMQGKSAIMQHSPGAREAYHAPSSGTSKMGISK